MVRRRRAACVWNGVSAVGNIPYALARECRFDRAAWGGRARGCVHQFPQTKSQTRRFRRFRVRDRYKRATLSGTTVETEVDRGTGGGARVSPPRDAGGSEDRASPTTQFTATGLRGTCESRIGVCQARCRAHRCIVVRRCEITFRRRRWSVAKIVRTGLTRTVNGGYRRCRRVNGAAEPSTR